MIGGSLLIFFIITCSFVHGHGAESLLPDDYIVHLAYNHSTQILTFTITCNFTCLQWIHLHYNYTNGQNDHDGFNNPEYNMELMNETVDQSIWIYHARSIPLISDDIVVVETLLKVSTGVEYVGVKEIRVVREWEFECKQGGNGRPYRSREHEDAEWIACIGQGLSKSQCRARRCNGKHTTTQAVTPIDHTHPNQHADDVITNRRLVIMAVVLPFVLMIVIIFMLVYVICRRKGGGSSTNGSSMSSYEASDEQSANKPAAKDKKDFSSKKDNTTHKAQNIYIVPPRRSNSLPSLDSIERRDEENIFTCTEDEDYYSYVDETGMHIIPYERPIIHIAVSSRRAKSVRTHKLQKRASQRSIDLSGPTDT